MRNELCRWFVAAFGAVLPALAPAQAPFDECLAHLRQRAVNEGVRPETAGRVLGTVTQAAHVLEADRRQPELMETFATYLSRRVTADRVARGRESFRRHQALLDRLTNRYGVPGQYLVALWGLETNYGSYMGSTRVFDSLATLACDERRSEYFSMQLVLALHIVEREELDSERMIGSWAGAMGQTQFMPSSYLAHAVDGDGDGVVDLWNSEGDALASAASLLRHLGWRPGLRWGREVALPERFDFYLTGRDRARQLEEWRRLGVTDVDGQALPSLDLRAALLVPSGHEGPAFLVYDNFNVIMEWNRSELYALTVGMLADRIAGGGALRTTPPVGVQLSRVQVAGLQERLSELGFDSGAADGVFGPATRAALREFQHARGLIADGYVNALVLEALGLPAH